MAIAKQPEPSIALRPLDRPLEREQVSRDRDQGPDLLHRIECKAVNYTRAKRALDVIGAAAGLVLLSPIFLIAALLVRITSRGPVIFRQTRVGEGGRYFTCLKFRSMVQDAERRKCELDQFNEASGPVFKMVRDPRITAVGGFMRKFSIDELPQLFNVLRGDMSLVGPRPPIPSEVACYDDHALGRLAVKPGLTCLWQIQGRSNIPFEQWVELDLAYIRNMSFWQDLCIIARTIPAVLTARGAR